VAEGAPRILFVDNFRSRDPGGSSASSDSLGYGITAADALCRGLAAHGYEVVRPLGVGAGTSSGIARTAWTAASYPSILRTLRTRRPDLVLCFHAFGPFPAEIRRMCLDLGLRVPIVGYTHGSHWDPTDGVRTERYPGMHLVDLANLHVLDRVLLVSEYLRGVLRREIAAFNADLAAELAPRMRVIGLPIDTELIDACRPPREDGPTTVVFNHAPAASKRPEVFLQVVARLLAEHEVRVLLTRRFPPWTSLADLVAAFPDRVLTGNDLPIEEYYRRLWRSDIQVSTATHESLGVATLEAMYTANYCVVPRIGSYPEILGDDYPGLYDGTPDQLDEHLRHALGDVQWLHEVSGRLPRLAQRYAVDRVVEALVAVLDEVLSA
jgi:glycosyltransferase involved in cell wall biosynthesis